MEYLPETIRKTLITIGQAARAGVQPPVEDLQRLSPHDAINRQRPEFWKNAAVGLTDEELGYLTCGLTYIEANLRWSGGSVSGVIWLFQSFVARGTSTALLDEISSWVIEHTKNPYNPFGTIVTLDARNFSEYKRLSHERGVMIQHELDRDKEFEKEANEQRKLRKQLRLFGAQHRETPEREELIEKINGMSVRDQLLLISKDDKHLPNFYPTKCADSADLTVIESLPEKSRYALANKMKGKYRGPWGKFKKRLLSVCGLVGDKEPWNI